MTTAIVKAPGSAITGSVELRGLSDVFALAEQLARAGGFVPRAYNGKPEAIAACILTGLELGLGPMESLRAIHVIEGRPSMSAELMLARAIRAGVRPKWIRNDETEARLELSRDGFEPHTHSFTMDDARRGGCAGKDNWKRWPANMLRARCVSGALRAFAPDVLGAVSYVPEEIEDGPIDDGTEPRSDRHGWTASSLRGDADVIEGAARDATNKAGAFEQREAWEKAGDLAGLETEWDEARCEQWIRVNGWTLVHMHQTHRSYCQGKCQKARERFGWSREHLSELYGHGWKDKDGNGIPDSFDPLFVELETVSDRGPLRQWCESYALDLATLEGAAKKSAWRKIVDRARQVGATADEVKVWLTPPTPEEIAAFNASGQAE